MANVQPNQFTKVANELLEIMPYYKFNGTQLRIILVVWRYTYGYKRKHHDLSVSFLENATGISKRQIQKEVQNLVELNVLIEVKKATFNQTRVIAFNKDYDKWKIGRSGTNELQVNYSTPHEPEYTSTGELQYTSTGERLFTQERNIKENIKEREEEEANPFLFFEQNGFGMISGYISDEFSYWIDGGFFNEPKLIIIEALKEAVEANVRKLNYVKSCLIDWNKKGAKTLSDVQALKEHHKQKTNITKNGHTKQNGTRSLFAQGEESKKRQERGYVPIPNVPDISDDDLPY